MKKYLILSIFISIILSSCIRQTDNNIDSNEIPVTDNAKEEPEVDYSKFHELALMFEKYAGGYDLSEFAAISYTIGLLADLNKQDKFLDDTSSVKVAYEDVKEISSLFMKSELINEDSCNYSFSIAKYPDIYIEPFEIVNEKDQIKILYGRFINDDDGNKHWLYPVRYTAVLYILPEENIPLILSNELEAGEQMYRIINVENIYDIKSVKEIY